MEIQPHGALIEVQGVGVLLLGPSGIGKSECALELVHRGHRLVADDIVRVRARSGPRGIGGELVGTAPELVRHYLEIRGIGILYVPDLYGPDAVLDEAVVELLCRLREWREGGDYERIGIDRPTEELAGVRVPLIELPARPAGSVATLVEVAVRDHLQRRAGRASGARRLDEAWAAHQKRGRSGGGGGG